MEKIFLKRLELTGRRHSTKRMMSKVLLLYIYIHTYFHAAFPIYTVQTHTTK